MLFLAILIPYLVPLLTIFNFAREGDASATEFFEFSYHHDDYPELWELESPLDTVYMVPEESVHYQTVHNADEDWEPLFQPSDGFIYLGKDQRQFSIAMLHQLRCLQIIRYTIIENQQKLSSNITIKPDHLVDHCIGYLRQIILCQADTTVESLRSHTGGDAADLESANYTCKDWTQVFESINLNHAQYSQWKSANMNLA